MMKRGEKFPPHAIYSKQTERELHLSLIEGETKKNDYEKMMEEC